MTVSREQIHQQLLSRCAEFSHLSRVLTLNGPQSLERQEADKFLPYLSRAVAGQQLSVNAAKTIWGRVETLCQQHGSLHAVLVDEQYEALRTCGLSNAKVKTLLGINRALNDGTISAQIYHSDDADFITKQLVQLWGVGQWTAEMALMFFFALPDVWSAGDVALARGLNLLAEKEGVAAEKILQAATPYRTYLALHIWQMLDANLMVEQDV
ncbi:DNA-3-methyladenine glycosylase family protein [Vibrio navarrensis]|uniref:DNA-3-methyladenine glycosylase family protein n=2 Tax=Vibrio navarrensis TaxID=29495 RepID=UPI001D036024|nr:DNA-3-methyladenine glycosylase 2 family protein [Vibrio navarrensis]MBE4620158.1 3-methyladenine DNA glycosylase [Vibrio navarrensis]